MQELSEGGEAGQYSPGVSAALTQIVPYSASLYTVFHSVFYNSVGSTQNPKIFENENFAAFAMRKRAAKFADFSGIEILKIYLMGSNLLLFENCKKVLNYSAFCRVEYVLMKHRNLPYILAHPHLGHSRHRHRCTCRQNTILHICT